MKILVGTNKVYDFINEIPTLYGVEHMKIHEDFDSIENLYMTSDFFGFPSQ